MNIFELFTINFKYFYIFLTLMILEVFLNKSGGLNRREHIINF